MNGDSRTGWPIPPSPWENSSEFAQILAMNDFRTLDDIDVKGRRVLVRTDLNVPIKDGVIGDMLLIDRHAPTILELAEKDARVIVLSHFDRLKGKVIPSMSLKTIAPTLEKDI